ncbi:MAG: SOS response-associated peptidase family protein [Firmicutes bacterium]|nr:SOS response-associated peptidase family protein [Bacillota bacterium]MBR3260156.1 SOS response-associated peptidase family protein [Bacillota bacterium]
MCYRFYIDLFFKNRVKKEISDKGILVPADGFAALSEPRDVYPSEKALVIAGSRGALSAESMGWGFSNPVSKGLLANARSESIKEKPTFRESAFLRRCAIPASGFYEWDEYKARYKFFRTDEELLWLAGIYRMENGLKRFTVLTREAAGVMVPIHPRMPVTLSGFEINTWISDAGFMDDLFRREPRYLSRVQDGGQISMDLGI